MASKDFSFDTHKNFLVDFYMKFLYQYEGLYQYLEENSIFWNDEIEFIISIIVKSIKQLKNEKDTLIIKKRLKDRSDKNFITDLLKKTIEKESIIKKLVEKHLTNWEYERLALMDKIILSMAITEIIEIPEIPVRASFDEYIEISKWYSTQRSSKFVNGVLDSVIKKLDKEGKIKLLSNY